MKSSVKRNPGHFSSHEMLGCDHSCWYPTKEAKGTHLCEHLSLICQVRPHVQLAGIPKRAVHPTLSGYLGAAE